MDVSLFICAWKTAWGQGQQHVGGVACALAKTAPPCETPDAETRLHEDVEDSLAEAQAECLLVLIGRTGAANARLGAAAVHAGEARGAAGCDSSKRRGGKVEPRSEGQRARHPGTEDTAARDIGKGQAASLALGDEAEVRSARLSSPRPMEPPLMCGVPGEGSLGLLRPGGNTGQ